MWFGSRYNGRRWRAVFCIVRIKARFKRTESKVGSGTTLVGSVASFSSQKGKICSLKITSRLTNIFCDCKSNSLYPFCSKGYLRKTQGLAQGSNFHLLGNKFVAYQRHPKTFMWSYFGATDCESLYRSLVLNSGCWQFVDYISCRQNTVSPEAIWNVGLKFKGPSNFK